MQNEDDQPNQSAWLVSPRVDRNVDRVGSVVQRYLEEEARRRAQFARTTGIVTSVMEQIRPYQSVVDGLNVVHRLHGQIARSVHVAGVDSIGRQLAAAHDGFFESMKLAGSFAALASARASMKALEAFTPWEMGRGDRLVDQVNRGNAAILSAFKVASLPEFDKVRAYAEAVRGQDLTLREHLDYLTHLGVSADLDGGEEERDDSWIEEGPAVGGSGIRFGDQVKAIVIEGGQSSDQSWWSSRPAIDRLNTILTILSILLGILALAIDEGLSDEQAQTLVESAQATRAAVEHLARLEGELASRQESDNRYDSLIAASLSEIDRRLAGRPCQARVATSMRGYGPQGEISHRVEPGQLALCLGHQGKWIEVVYEAEDGEVKGWVLKKHFQLARAR